MADIILTEKDSRRFWEKTRWDPTTGCLEWTACRDGWGYGRFGMRGVIPRAHRVAWALGNGQIPGGVWVLHKCDNPRCVNVEHLFLGTQASNMADMASKGRSRCQKKTHCKRGHPLTGDNLYAYVDGRRHCRACRRTADIAYRLSRAKKTHGGALCTS